MGVLTDNKVLIIALVAWVLAQILKVPTTLLREHKLDVSWLVQPGGMPSSHAAIMTAATHAIGLYVGFDSPLFALGVVITMIVVYDATGIRRQAGKHAELLNKVIADLLAGHLLFREYQEQLQEVLGHTQLEALGGVLLGIATAQTIWFFWH